MCTNDCTLKFHVSEYSLLNSSTSFFSSYLSGILCSLVVISNMYIVLGFLVHFSANLMLRIFLLSFSESRPRFLVLLYMIQNFLI